MYEWLKQSLVIGVTFSEFWSMTPKDIMVYCEAYKKRQEIEFENENLIAYLQGMYVGEALRSTVCNMFVDKGKKPYEYPDKPFVLFGEEYTEDEIEEQRKAFWQSLKVAQTNFELAKGSST